MAWPKDGPNYRPAKGFVEKPASGIPAGGEGWGGAAKGLSVEFSSDAQPTPEAKREGHQQAATLRELLAPHKQALVDTWVAVMEDKMAPASARVAAANAIADRLEGAAKQTVDLTQRDERTAEQIQRDVTAKMALAGLLNGPGNASSH